MPDGTREVFGPVGVVTSRSPEFCSTGRADWTITDPAATMPDPNSLRVWGV